MTKLREARQNYALAQEDGRNDDAQDYLTNQEALETQLERLRNGLGSRQQSGGDC